MTLRYFHGENEIAKRVAQARNKPAEETADCGQQTAEDTIIAELLQQNRQLLEMLVKKSE